MVEIDNLSFAYSKETVLEGVRASFSGERVLITGKNGSGKTALFLAIAGILPPKLGRVIVNGIDTNLEEIHREVGIIFQNPEDQLFAPTVEREIAFALENFSFPPDEIRKRIDLTLKALSIEHLRSRSPDELSGGEKQLVALASVLAYSPGVLLLDEPDTFLDWEAKRRFRRYLDYILRDNPVQILEITLNPYDISRRNDAFLLVNKAIKPLENPEMLFSSGSIDWMLFRLESEFGEEFPQSFRLKTTVSKAEGGKRLVLLDGVRYRGESGFLLELDKFELFAGETVGIIGRNGSGKSTLAQIIAAVLKPQSGRMELAGRCGMLFQFSEMNLFEEDVLSEVSFGPRNIGSPEPEVVARRVLSEVGMGEEYYTRQPILLSSGEKRKVALASILALEPDILILDEPTSGLDFDGRYELERMLAKQRGKGIILISHDLDFILRNSDRVLLLDDGKIIFYGETAKLFSDTELIERLGLPIPISARLEAWACEKGIIDGFGSFDVERIYNRVFA